MSFTFNPERHEYRLDGVRLPSVTEILHVAGMLPDYSFVEEFYSERGKAVHAAIALDLAGTLDEGSVSEEVWPYLERARWAVKFGFAQGLCSFPVVETPFYDPMNRFAGTPDLVADLSGPRPTVVVIDWKTGAIEPGHSIQAAAYCMLTNWSSAAGIDLPTLAIHSYVVSLATSPPKILHLGLKQINGFKMDFIAALRIYRFREAHGLLPKNPITEVSHDGADIP